MWLEVVAELITIRQGSPFNNSGEDNDREEDNRGIAWISALSNLSIQYNIGVIAPALLLLDPSRAKKTDTGASLYPRSDETDSMLKSAVFGGAILGQLTMGLLGDVIGLEVAMIVTNMLALAGTIGCTIAPVVGNTSTSVYTTMIVFRAILGLGVGGKSVLLWFMGEPREDRWRHTLIQYILLVGLGAIPSALVLVNMLKQLNRDNSASDEDRQNVERCCGPRQWIASRRGGYRTIQRTHPVLIAVQNRSSWSKLAGTGLCWALYDFVYYGTSFNLPEIFSRVLGGGEDLLADSWHNALIALIGIPGVISAIRVLEPIGGPKALQWWGFVAIGVASMLVALSYEKTDSGRGESTPFRTWVAIAACSLLIFTINWGCNVSTYVLPIEVFPPSIASTFHGWSAAMGKCGAALGGFFFTKLNAVSVTLTFTVSIACCVVGSCLTHHLIHVMPTRGTVMTPLSTKDSNSSLEAEEDAELTNYDYPISSNLQTS